MVCAGIDVGSSTTKVVLLADGAIASHSLIPTGASSAGSAQTALDIALEKAGLSFVAIDSIVATGYGRVLVPFSHEVVTELSCHARGAHYIFPSARTILDMGGQDCKAIRCDAAGRLMGFAMNDKCAAGTGRFLEVMSQVIEIPLERMGEESLLAQQAVKINSTCAVFAKTEVASLLRRGADMREVLAGLNRAIALRTFTLVRHVHLEPDFVITGGIAKNMGVVKALEERARLTALIPPEPQIVGALGAALFARDRIDGDGAH